MVFGGKKKVPAAAVAMKERVETAGFKVHKEQLSTEIEVLGVAVGGHPPFARPKRDNFWSLFEATVFLISLDYATGDAVEVIVRHWTWFALLARPILAIWDTVYEFSRRFRGHPPQPLWKSVKRELSCMLGVSVFIRSDLSSG